MAGSFISVSGANVRSPSESTLAARKREKQGEKEGGRDNGTQGSEVSEIKIEIRRAALKMVREEVMWSSRGTEFHTEKPLEQRPWARASLIWAEEQEAFVRGDKWVREEKSRKGWRQRSNEEPDVQRLWATMKPLALALGETGDAGNFRPEAWHDDSGWAGGRWVWEVEAEGQWGSFYENSGETTVVCTRGYTEDGGRWSESEHFFESRTNRFTDDLGAGSSGWRIFGLFSSSSKRKPQSWFRAGG